MKRLHGCYGCAFCAVPVNGLGSPDISSETQKDGKVHDKEIVGNKEGGLVTNCIPRFMAPIFP